MLTLLFALGSKLIDSDIMTTKSWIIFGIHAAFLTTSLLAVLLPSSYINRQSEWQIERLLRLREIYQRIVRDVRTLEQNPKRLSTKIQRLSVTLLRNATSDLTGEERYEKMAEVA